MRSILILTMDLGFARANAQKMSAADIEVFLDNHAATAQREDIAVVRNKSVREEFDKIEV
jgi:hypothetical protein